MEKRQKPRTSSDPGRLFKRRRRSPEAMSAIPSSAAGPPILEVYGDIGRTMERYREASQLLHDAVKGHQKWGAFDFPELAGEPEGFNDSKFKEKIEEVLQAQKQAMQELSGWGKCKHLIQCAFAAFSPFAKNFLTIAKEAQQIAVLNPYGLLCGGLLLLITIADKEVGRKATLERTMDYMCQELEQLAILDVLPDDLVQRDFVINRAFDVRSATMLFLALNIRHDSTFLGIPGRIVKVFFSGDEKITDSMYFEKCVESYSRALSNAGVRSIFKVLEIVKGIDALNIQVQGLDRTWLENRFIVPYDRNPKLTGRSSFIQEMKEKLVTEVPRQYNHRIALHGMGGIGKTQCALEYIYSNRTFYSRIYWISAADETSILSGYEKIAKAAQLQIPPSTTPRDIAGKVLTWLLSQSSWLLVVDNLDDYEVARGLLPENGPGKHTVITTRNPKTMTIPAESMEVPLLDVDASVELLLTLSLPESTPNTEQKEEARIIVEDLGRLPLAILQAAAFIREVTGSITTYRDSYNRNRKELIKWPTNDPGYPYSVATTWSMSFTVLQSAFPQAARLLQLFSLLNPDGILIDFLVDGASGLDDELRQIISNQVELAKVLLELEKYSLIKWDRESKSIFMHRLVQMVVNDEMSEELRQSTSDAIINLCVRAFPRGGASYSLCRLYEPQVVNALYRLQMTPTRTAAEIMLEVAAFLMSDYRYSSSRELLLRAHDISTSLFAEYDDFTFEAERGIANLYALQGNFRDALETLENISSKIAQSPQYNNREVLLVKERISTMLFRLNLFHEAVEMLERLVEESTKLLGADDVLTMTAAHGLATSYDTVGRIEEAVKLGADVLARRRRVLGELNINTLFTLQLHCISLGRVGRLEEAIELGEECLRKSKVALGESHSHVYLNLRSLAGMYISYGNATKAEALFEEVETLKTRMGMDARKLLEGLGYL